MKVTELMLGDWVEFQGEYYQIATLKNSGVIELQYSDGTLVSLTTSYIEDVIKPIPITPEILKLNGFEKKYMEKGMKYCKQDAAVMFADKIYDFNEIYTIGPHGNGVRKRTDQTLYIHELQHALRLWGLDELADNFLVTKGEIQ